MKLAALAAFLCACGGGDAVGAGATSANASNTSAGECWPVAPMRMEILEHHSAWEPVAEIQGDGAIYDLRKERHFLGRITRDQLVDVHDVPTITCTHREIYSPMNPSLKAHYGSRDEWVDGGMSIAIADDGTVNVTMGSRQGENILRVIGPIPKTRRTAELLVIMLMSNPLNQ